MLAKEKGKFSLGIRCITQYDDHIPDFYRVFECDAANVCDALRDEVEYWEPRNPVLLVAPTGKGKTTLIYMEVIPRAIRCGKNVLLISNRIALSIQQKLTIMKILQCPWINWLTEEGIYKTENFGSVAVLTYHRLPAFLNNPKNQEWLKDLGYVVADEAHFFTADSSFNELCGYYLKRITREFRNAVRIYMTATPWDIIHPLAEAEQKNYCCRQAYFGPWQPPRAFLFYRFDADYRHVDLNFFDDMEEITEKIDANPDEKWLVFVDNKTKGQNFAADLGDRAVYLDADSKGSDQWNELTRSARFSRQVLVTTAVLDCGVNIIDPALKSIVITTDDRTALTQMLGRKRCAPGERIKLYVCDISPRKISHRHKDYLELRQWHDRFDQSSEEDRRKMARELWHNPDGKLRHYFDLANGYLVPNRIAFFALERKLRFYGGLLSGAYTFREAVREWLGLTEDPDEDPEEKLLGFCEANLGQELNEAQIKSFRKLVIAAAKRHGFAEPQPRRLDSLGREALNNRLEYFGCSFSLAKGHWTIEKTGGT